MQQRSSQVDVLGSVLSTLTHLNAVTESDEWFFRDGHRSIEARFRILHMLHRFIGITAEQIHNEREFCILAGTLILLGYSGEGVRERCVRLPLGQYKCRPIDKMIHQFNESYYPGLINNT